MLKTILVSAHANNDFESTWLNLLTDIGYQVTFLDHLGDHQILSLILVSSKSHVGVVEMALKQKHILSKGVPYLFLNPDTNLMDRPDAGIWVIQESSNAMEIVYKIEKMIGLPEIMQEMPLEPVQTSTEKLDEISKDLQFHLSQKADLEAERARLELRLKDKTIELEHLQSTIQEQNEKIQERETQHKQANQLITRLKEVMQ